MLIGSTWFFLNPDLKGTNKLSMRIIDWCVLIPNTKNLLTTVNTEQTSNIYLNWLIFHQINVLSTPHTRKWFIHVLYIILFICIVCICKLLFYFHVVCRSIIINHICRRIWNQVACNYIVQGERWIIFRLMNVIC